MVHWTKSRIVAAVLVFMLLAGGILAGAFVVAVLILSWEINWSDRKIAESQRIGNQVVRALADYHQVHGKFPDNLEQLVGRQLASIPSPTAGTRRWVYKSFDSGQRFELGFETLTLASEAGYPCCFYSSETKDWYVDN